MSKRIAREYTRRSKVLIYTTQAARKLLPGERENNKRKETKTQRAAKVKTLLLKLREGGGVRAPLNSLHEYIYFIHLMINRNQRNYLIYSEVLWGR